MYPAGVPYLAPYLIRAGAPHYIKPFYFSRQDSGRHDWPRRERQTKLKRFNPGSPWRLIWTGQAGAPEVAAGRAGVIQAGRSPAGPGVHLQGREGLLQGLMY